MKGKKRWGGRGRKGLWSWDSEGKVRDKGKILGN